ncbi:MAG: hypothetical protein IPM29_13890 [Planctomycetes bacterium]|nr:hypothetical protein [Planctomycetota bacterium]
MMQRRAALLAALCAASALGGGCAASYATQRMEFDSMTGFEDTATEPASFEPSDRARRWPGIVRWWEGTLLDVALAGLWSLEPRFVEIDQPAKFLRERIEGMVRRARGDVGRLADCSHRVLWLLARDPQELDRLVAVDAVEDLLAELGVDPLKVPTRALDSVASLAREKRELTALAAAVDALADRAPRPAEGFEVLRRLRALSARPGPSPEQGRQAIRALLDAAVRLRDPRLRRAARYALADRCGCELGQELRVLLLDRAPNVRESALLALRRRSGPRAVNAALFAFASLGGGPRYDQDVAIRRQLVRLCAQLPRDLLLDRFSNGPRPLEFLFDTATADADEGLRMVALDALARVTGRPVELEPEWAESFWRSEVLVHGADRGAPR